MAKFGFGHHIKALSNDDRITALCLYWVSQITYKITLQLTKISLVLLYIRIFGTVYWFKRLGWFLIGLLALYGLASCLTGLVQCNPIPKAWNSAVAGSCINLMQFFIFNGAMALATDAIILILPLPMVYGLQLPLAQKLALIPRLRARDLRRHHLGLATLRPRGNPSADTTYDLMGTLWTIVEYNIAIVCASLPTVRVLLVGLFPKAFRSVNNSVKRTGTGGGSFGTKHSANGWSRVDGKDEVMLTSVSNIKSNDTSSEEHILEGSRGIHKTTRYEVKYGEAV